jgi:Ni,Fe-hydrogenase I large subunit
MATVTIDPLTRIEGHLAVHTQVEAGRVVDARIGGEMFRGFETILQGRHPMDAQQITQRICGVCPVSHGTASVLAQEMAYRISPPKNGWLLRNLILGANYIQSHILHFYHLAALDYVDITAVTGYAGKDRLLQDVKGWVAGQTDSKAAFPAAPFLPRYEGKYIKDSELNLQALRHYLQALDMRALAHKMCALFAGKMPHVASLVPGGVTERVTADKIAAYGAMLAKLQAFIESAYLPDVLEVAAAFPEYFSIGRGCGNFLACGGFVESQDGKATFLPSGTLIEGKLAAFDPARITEDVKYSLFSSPSGLAPAVGATVPQPGKREAYSWLKAPRYGEHVMEVGPLARLLVSYHGGALPQAKAMVDAVLARFDARPEALVSVLGRHAARAIECKLVADRCVAWLGQLDPQQPSSVDFDMPAAGSGMGFVEAPRGALGHWIEIRDRKISRYQCVVPTTWNGSPRDDRGNAGAMEQALVGTPVADPANPLEVARIVRSFDPCIACAVH